jgi:hypothetical protein
MATAIVPSINSSGIFTLAAPFEAMLTAGMSYTCRAVRTIADLVADGKDPYTDTYVANGLTQTQYNTDVANGVCIVSLAPTSTSGTTVYVPSSFITALPSSGGVNYQILGLLVNMGALPVSTDLTYLKTQISEIVQNTIGSTPTLTAAKLSAVSLLSSADDAKYQAARALLISSSQTNLAKALTNEAALASATQKITALEAYIVQLNAEITTLKASGST